MATADKLTYLNATKLLLRDAIRRAGHYLPDAATFRSYPYALLPDEASMGLDFVRGEYVAHNWRDGTVSRAGLSNIMTTTRASGGGYFDHLGVYQWAANNTPRIDHDPATLSTSTTSATLASGPVTLAVTVTYTVGSYVRATYDGSNWMAGLVTASTGSSVTLWVDRVVGSGTYASWTVIRVLGLLVEEGMTNLLLRSAEFISTAWSKRQLVVDYQGVTAPDGKSLSAKISPDTTRDEHYVEQPLSTAGAAGDYVFSTFVKNAGVETFSVRPVHVGETQSVSEALFTFSGDELVTGAVMGRVTRSGVISLGGGWFRVWVAYSVTASTTSHRARVYPSLAGARTGDGVTGLYIWGAQLEAGSFLTSYIPTAGSQVTRAVDLAVVNELSPWHNPGQGAFVVEFQTQRTRGFPTIFSLTGDFFVWGNPSNNNFALNGRGNTGWAVISSPPLQGLKRYAIAVDDAGVAVSVNGSAVTRAQGVRLNAMTALQVSGSLCGHIKSIRYFPRALTSEELQEIAA